MDLRQRSVVTYSHSALYAFVTDTAAGRPTARRGPLYGGFANARALNVRDPAQS